MIDIISQFTQVHPLGVHEQSGYADVNDLFRFFLDKILMSDDAIIATTSVIVKHVCYRYDIYVMYVIFVIFI